MKIVYIRKEPKQKKKVEAFNKFLSCENDMSLLECKFLIPHHISHSLEKMSEIYFFYFLFFAQRWQIYGVVDILVVEWFFSSFQ